MSRHIDLMYAIGRKLGKGLRNVVACPICGKELARSQIAVKPHMVMHRRNKELTEEREREIFRELFPRIAQRIDRSIERNQ